MPALNLLVLAFNIVAVPALFLLFLFSLVVAVVSGYDLMISHAASILPDLVRWQSPLADYVSPLIGLVAGGLGVIVLMTMAD